MTEDKEGIGAHFSRELSAEILLGVAVWHECLLLRCLQPVVTIAGF